MKIRFIFTALCLVLSLCYSLQSSAQGTATLRVAAMPGFPDLPADSAYEGQTYVFDLFIVNNSSTNINGANVTFNMRVDSIITPFLLNPALSIPAGDSVTLTVTQYSFNQPQFKMGNNIVVVWPVVSGLVVPIDSLITNVYFIPLSSLGSIDLTEPAFKIYPVPAKETLHLKLNTELKVEYVRIYTMEGRIVYIRKNFTDDFIDISNLSNGVYVLETEIDGKLDRIRFVRN